VFHATDETRQQGKGKNKNNKEKLESPTEQENEKQTHPPHHTGYVWLALTS
jgi:hypothetical protein